ncbi:hypothetical protein MMG85_11910 [Pseudoxanthomonas sp. LH2527]|uniref:hypothetical protein n=1 Tax=Pseudoxanthomonas sp. LH2527 TaxID=2923249 RepID=UPI001F13275A|nr:hypothetical protein [Pseudoxanthomonas sp. LH2527]MCH6484263.1 hypothetical protein [Pseudoxanthomonas sp. LH2527]
MSDKVARLRQLMADAVPRPAARSQAEEDMWARYAQHAANAPEPFSLDDTQRALDVRAINRIATWYNASSALIAWLDKAGASCISGLDDEQVSNLRAYMQQIEDCAQSGFDSPFAPTAG